MGRKPCCRRVSGAPKEAHFGPVAGARGGVVRLTLDELESLKLADVEGRYQAEAAEQMGVSRATFGRIVSQARRKVATALLEGQELVIGGGHVQLGRSQVHRCQRCHHRWSGEGHGAQKACPRCVLRQGE